MNVRIGRNCSLLALVLSLATLAPAQENQASSAYLSPQEALRLAMEQNLGREIARQNESIARKEYSLGNAGFLPSVSAVGAKRWSVEDSEQVRISGESRSLQGVRSNNFNFGMAASWVLFDGFRMFRSYDRLGIQYQASQQLNLDYTNTLAADVLSAYYRHTLQQQQVKVWESTLGLSEQRLRLAKDRYEVGRSSKQEYLSALVDYNADQAALLAQQEALLNARHALNRVLGLHPSRALSTADTLVADSSLIAGLAKEQPLSNNPELIAASLQVEAAELIVQEERGRYFPEVSFDVGYNFIRQNTPGGLFALYNQTSGLTYGLSASWLLFDGFANRRNIQIANLQKRITELNRQQLELDLSTEQADATAAYRNSWKRVALEQENVAYARQNASIALDRYQLGVTTSLELRVAQQNAQQAELRLLNAVYELKLAETELLRIAGQLTSTL